MKIYKLHVRIVILVLSVIMVSLVPVYAGTSEDDDDIIDSQRPEERVAPAFELAGLDGREYRLRDFIDSTPVIVWFTNLCEGCQANIPSLDSIYLTDIKPQAELLAISLLGKDHETVETISGKLKFDFPILFDPEGSTCKDYVGSYVPASCPISNLFIIDRKGIIRFETHYPGHSLSEGISILREINQMEDNKKAMELDSTHSPINEGSHK